MVLVKMGACSNGDIMMIAIITYIINYNDSSSKNQRPYPMPSTKASSFNMWVLGKRERERECRHTQTVDKV